MSDYWRQFGWDPETGVPPPLEEKVRG